MSATAIQWAGHVWNFCLGCLRVSPGCGGGTEGPLKGGCYAETMAARIVRMGGFEWNYHAGRWEEDAAKKATTASRATALRYLPLVRMNKAKKARWTGTFAFDTEKLLEPLSWRSPRLVFVNSMSDLFGEGLTNEQIAAAFCVMAAAPQSTFQILTKRAKRMTEWFQWVSAGPARPTKRCELAFVSVVREALGARGDRLAGNLATNGLFDRPAWPLSNVWLGVSCERQQEADERIPLLLQCPAAVRWVSAEPLLGPIDFTHLIHRPGCQSEWTGKIPGAACTCAVDEGLHWTVFGGESGHGARPCRIEWIRDGVRQLHKAGLPAFVKQVGSYPVDFHLDMASEYGGADESGYYRATLKDKKGADPAEWPEDLRVREWPHGFTPPKSKKLPVVSEAPSAS